MSSAGAHKGPYLNVREFLSFLDSRPDEERWELINGIPMMMAPPKIKHQHIASNLEQHLNAALREHKPQWHAYREIGLVLDEEGHYRPEPEIAVVDADINQDRTHADRFYLVAEVGSPSDQAKYAKSEKTVLEAKLGFYQAHTHNRCVMIIRQDALEVTMYLRSLDGRWPDAPLVLRAAGDAIVASEIGPICTVGDLYSGTSLDPHRTLPLAR